MNFPAKPKPVLDRDQIAAEVRASFVEVMSFGAAYVASHPESVRVSDLCGCFSDAVAVVQDVEERLGLEMGALDAEQVYEETLRDLIDAVEGLI